MKAEFPFDIGSSNACTYPRVSGGSMDRVGFVTGDVIAVQCEREPVNGEAVVARLGNEVTLKRFRRRDADTVELQPESTKPEHRTLRVGPDTEDFRIAEDEERRRGEASEAEMKSATG